MPPQIITILKQFKIFYNSQSKAYQIPFNIYPKLYKEINNLLQNPELKELPEFKTIDLEPIPLLPLDVATKAKELKIIKYRETLTNSQNKKSSKEITLDFSKDIPKTIDSLPPKFL